MILPGSYAASLFLLLLSMLCWGSWANTFKLTGTKWRFELFYFDFAIGVFVCSIIAGLTFGSLGWDGFQFMDDLKLAGRRQDVFAFAAGIVFNLANMLLVAAISVAGMAVAFPVGIGLALVIGVIWSFIIRPVGSPVLLAAGCAAIVGAIVVDALAYRFFSLQKLMAAVQQGKTKSTKKSFGAKGIVLSIASGLLMGSFYPMVELARKGENGLGPYAVGFVFAVGVLISTFIFNLFFMNLPVQGEPVEMYLYFRGSLKQHFLGWLGGIFWYIGAVSNFVAARAEGPAQVGPAVSYALGQGATLISALWGLLIWKEFAGADGRVRSLIITMLILFVIGLAIVSVAPLYGSR
jgi:glucose uptake protein